MGLIKLKDDVGLLPTALDITENPKNLKIVELEAPQLPRSLDDAQIALAVINTTYASQINLTPAAIPYLNDNGSITLISGILSEEPINWGVSATTINGAIEHFVKGAACELPRGLRINVVSPTVLEESMGKYADFFPGFVPVPAARVAQAYQKSVLGVQTGQIFRVNG